VVRAAPIRPTGGVPRDDCATVAARITANVARVVEGKDEVIRTAVVVLLAEGHLLLEDVPGVGKTTLAKALAQSLGASVSRIQFTPDLLPSDITGVSVFDAAARTFEYRPGPVFANIVVADEINRASPKTQSALLECMEERQVTADGTTYELGMPFLVIATQNPAEMEGTYTLPEAQRDRFTARVSMGYPSPRAEVAMLSVHAGVTPPPQLGPVTDVEQVQRLIGQVTQVFVSPAAQQYAVTLVTATRNHRDVLLGASPRATVHLVRAARALAAVAGRDHVLPDDLQELAVPVLAHRLLLRPEAQLAGRTQEALVGELCASVPVAGPRG
jgi:MoxR-like ATPase